MIQKNNKISSFQIFVMSAMIGNALFVGMGNIITVIVAKENTWLVAIISAILGIIPVLFLNKIMNYEPSLNIFEKNIKLLGKILGHVLNLLLTMMIAFIFVIVIWALSNFASVKYLTETPIWFLASLFILPVTYASFKGIECISRTIEIMFYVGIVIIFIITSGLFQFIDINNLKPILAEGVKPVAISVLNYITYAFTPFIALLVIPKDTVINKEKVNKNLIFGYLFLSFLMFLVFFYNMTVVGYNVLSMYRYPEYFVIKKISISPAFDNVENFLSLHWTFNLISLAFICSYFIKTYFLTTFEKIKNSKPIFIKLIVVFVNLLIIFGSEIAFKSTTEQGKFMYKKFPVYIGLISIILIVIINIIIIFKNKNSKK